MKRLIALIIVFLAVICTANAESVVFAFEQLEYEVATNKQIKLKPVAQNIPGTLKYTWESSDKNIATVNSGTVTGKSYGAVEIFCTATDKDNNEYKASCIVNVFVPVSSLAVKKNSVTLAALSPFESEPSENDERFFFTPEITIKPDNATNKNLEWSSSDPLVAMVNKDGHITSGSIAGTAKITGTTTDGTNKKVYITVTIPKIYVTANSLVIETEDGVEFGYQMNASGISTSGTKGDCFTTQSLSDVGGLTMVKVIPVKTGSGSFVIRSGGQTKTVNVTVRDSAIRSNRTYPAQTVQKLLADKEKSYGAKTNFTIDSVAKTETGFTKELILPYVVEPYTEMYDYQIKKSVSIVKSQNKEVEYWAVIHNTNAKIGEKDQKAYGTVIGYMTYISETGLQYECPVMYDVKFKAQ